MSGNLLLVDDFAERRNAFAGVLTERYFRVIEVDTADIAIDAAAETRPSLVLINADCAPPLGMPLCQRLKAALPEPPPVLLYGGGGKAPTRCAALRSGADDFVQLPRDEIVLFARLRALIRMNGLAEELRLRRASATEMGFVATPPEECRHPAPKILFVAPKTERSLAFGARVAASLGGACAVSESGFDALRKLDLDPPDAVVVSGSASLNHAASGFAERESPIELITAISAASSGRRAPVLFLADPLDDARTGLMLANALDAGAADCAFLDEDGEELAIRLAAHLKRKRYADDLRSTVENGLRQALRDPLTGLHNRRYLDVHFARNFRHAQEAKSPLSVLMFDLDRFKALNDEHGHAEGDAALVAFARLLGDEVRIGDFACRYGGEEFVVVMPNATIRQAAAAAERVRARTANSNHNPAFTVSVGVASMEEGDPGHDELLDRADAALRDAKTRGRDTVVSA